MTLLSVVTNVANEAGYTVESNITASVETTTKQLLAITQRINQEMATAYPWRKLFASGSITLVNGQATYALPAAFSSYHYETFWNSSTRYKLLGPMTEQEYAAVLGFGFNTTISQRFQLRGVSNSELLISPTPSASGDVIIFQYIADRAVRPKTWITATSFLALSYCSYNGNYYQTTLGGTTGATPPTHTSGTVTDGTVLWTFYGGAYSTFLADTDVSLFNEKTLELGVMEKFGEIHGLDTIKPRYQLQLNEDFSKDNPGKYIYADNQINNNIFAYNGIVSFGNGI